VETVESADAADDRPLAHAQIEKPVAHTKHRRLQITRRNLAKKATVTATETKAAVRKDYLAKTHRRSHA